LGEVDAAGTGGKQNIGNVPQLQSRADGRKESLVHGLPGKLERKCRRGFFQKVYKKKKVQREEWECENNSIISSTRVGKVTKHMRGEKGWRREGKG